MKHDKTEIKWRREKIEIPEEVVVKDKHSEKMRELNRSTMSQPPKTADDSVNVSVHVTAKAKSHGEQQGRKLEHNELSLADELAGVKKPKFDDVVKAGKKSVSISENVTTMDEDGEIESLLLSSNSPVKRNNSYKDRSSRPSGKRSTDVKYAESSEDCKLQ